MSEHFSDAERAFVASGGNLWYVRPVLGDGWEVIRWSRTGRLTVGPAQPSRSSARDQLFDFVKPSSFRTRTAVHHCLARQSPRERRDFPLMA